MFDVFGDDIVFYRGPFMQSCRTVARLTLPIGTERDSVESALQSYLDTDAISKLEEEAENNGRWDGRKVQWEMCFDAVDVFMSGKSAKAHKFTAEQREAVLECLKAIEPEK
jgi:hypothetical protein